MRQIWNVIKYILVFIFNLLILLFVHSYFNFVIMIVMIVLPIASIVCEALTIRNLHVHFGGADGRMTVDEPFLLSVNLDNSSIFPCMNVDIEIELSNELFGVAASHHLCMPAYAHRTDMVDYQLSQEYVGVTRARAASIAVTDWLGFVRMKKKCDESCDYVVFPDSEVAMEPDTSALSRGMTEMEETGRKGFDFSEVSDVREYRPGDKLQSIHWKLTAKRDELMVKERVSMSSSQLIILVELVNDESDVLNDIIKAAYGLSVYLIDAQIPFTLYYWSVSKGDLVITPVSGRDDVDMWIERVFYEKAYDDGDLGCNMLQKSLDSERRFLVIGRRGHQHMETVFTYGNQVEGYICG